MRNVRFTVKSIDSENALTCVSQIARAGCSYCSKHNSTLILGASDISVPFQVSQFDVNSVAGSTKDSDDIDQFVTHSLR